MEETRLQRIVKPPGVTAILLFAMLFAVCYLIIVMPKMIWSYKIKVWFVEK